MKTLIGILVLLTLPLAWLCTENQCLSSAQALTAMTENSSDGQHLFCARELLGAGHGLKAKKGYQTRHYY